jgi:hypothetical protein
MPYAVPLSWQTTALERPLQRNFQAFAGQVHCLWNSGSPSCKVTDDNMKLYSRLFQERAYIQGFPLLWFSSIVSQLHYLQYLNLQDFYVYSYP